LNETSFLPENYKGKDHFRNKDVDGKIIVRRMLVKWRPRMWTLFNWFWKGSGGGLGQVRQRMSHNQLSDYQLLKKKSVPWNWLTLLGCYKYGHFHGGLLPDLQVS
jgi:hypothetical protein